MKIKPEFEAQFEAQIKGLGNIYKTYSHFDESLHALKELGIRQPITARELAYARIQKGKDSSLYNNGSYINEGVIYIPKKGIFLTENSPVLIFSEQATRAHRDLEEFYITEEQVENSLKNSVKVPYNIKQIPTNRFNEEEITSWLFKDQAENYGNFLIDAKIDEILLLFYHQNYINNQKISFANQLWFGRVSFDNQLWRDDSLDFCNSLRNGLCDSFDERSNFDGEFRDLSCDDRVRGVLKKTHFVGSQKF